MKTTPLARLAVLGLLCLVATSGCVSVGFSVRTFGAANVDDLQAEMRYNAVYADQIQRIHADLKLFSASGSNPGVCDRGGSAPGCYAADAKAIGDIQATIVALQATPVPPRYVEPDRLLRTAFGQQIEGLQLRNKSLATSNDAMWTQHIAVLNVATTAIQQAYLAFPEDDRPLPAP